MNLTYQRGDIVLGDPSLPPACFCILDVLPERPTHPYTALNLVNLNLYQLRDEGMTKVGTATPEFLQAHAAAQAPATTAAADPLETLRFQRGQARAARESWHADGADRQRWETLAAAKPGDTLTLRHSCGHAEPFKFRFVLERGSKYVFVADAADGVATKFSLGVLPVAAVQPTPGRVRGSAG